MNNKSCKIVIFGCILVVIGIFLFITLKKSTEGFQKQHKIAAVYNVWDGLELLPYSLRQMVPFADVVILVTQTIGNNGVHDEEPRIFCENLKKEFPNIVVEVFNPSDKSQNISENRVSKQIQKRNRGIEIAESMGCNLVIFVDTDEITATNDLIKAYNLYTRSNKDTAIMLLKTYIRKPTYAVQGYDKTVKIAFFQKIGNGQRIEGWGSNDPVKGETVDMERTLNTGGSYMTIDPNVCIVHHYSHVRKDYEKKVAAHASQQLKSIGLHDEALHIEPGQRSKHYDAIIEEVPNYFNIVF
jgi:hypothetical protein